MEGAADAPRVPEAAVSGPGPSAYWAITPSGWRRAAALHDLPPSTAGFVRVEQRPAPDGSVRACVVEIQARDGARADGLVERFGHPPAADVSDAVVAEAIACADRVLGMRAGNPAAWDHLRDALIAAASGDDDDRKARLLPAVGRRLRAAVAAAVAAARCAAGLLPRPPHPPGVPGSRRAT